MIEVVNLSKSFGDNHVLKDITTTIKKGEKVNVNINPEQGLDVDMTLIVIANVTKLGKLK